MHNVKRVICLFKTELAVKYLQYFPQACVLFCSDCSLAKVSLLSRYPWRILHGTCRWLVLAWLFYHCASTSIPYDFAVRQIGLLIIEGPLDYYPTFRGRESEWVSESWHSKHLDDALGCCVCMGCMRNLSKLNCWTCKGLRLQCFVCVW